MSAPLSVRPVPLRDAFKSVGSVIAFVGAVAATLVSYGVLTAEQGGAVSGLVALVPGAVAALTGLLAAFGVVRRAEPLVTPVSDPAVEMPVPDPITGRTARQLVALVPDTRMAA